MPRRTDTRARMLDAAGVLFAERGFRGTSLDDVVAASGTPRGSVYFHFPGGKDQLITETTVRVAQEMPDLVRELAASFEDPGDIVLAFFAHFSGVVGESDYRRGCPVAMIALELAHDSSLRAPLASVFEGLRAAFRDVIIAAGADSACASAAATVVVSGFEGALIQARVMRSCAPIETTAREIAAYLRVRLDTPATP